MKKKILVSVGLVLFFLTVGFAGGMDTGRLGVAAGVSLAIVCEAGGAVALWKAGVLR